MKTVKMKNILNIFVLGIFFSSIVALFDIKPAYAGTAETKAQEYCAKYTGKNKESCEHGFVKGYNKSTGGDCFKYTKKELPDGTSSAKIKAHAIYKACADGKVTGKNQVDKDTGAANKQELKGSKCGEVTTFFDFSCGGDADSKSANDKNPIFRILLTIVAWLTAGVMVAVIGGIVYGGYLYMTAQDNAGQTQKGITVIVDSVIGLIAFGLMWTILNFIIPGGIYAG